MSDEPMDEAEGAAWREAYRGFQAPGSSGCPDDEALAALATGETTGAERERLADHVVGCRRCAERYRVLRDLHREAGSEPEHEGAGSGGRGSRLRLLAAAAALLLVAGLGWIVGLPGTSGVLDPDRLRGEPAMEEGVRPAPDARLAAPPRELAWPARRGAHSYRVILYDATSSPLWTSAPVTAPILTLPDEARSRLVGGDSYFWIVETGHGPDAPVSRLGPFWFSLEERRER
ncbi:MAG TPA: hypothetical protein VEL74_18040 [Thermoanaerobaculia bacterium]|nr:hypothetical protein [Thermoanaerobaculia bacterium]